MPEFITLSWQTFDNLYHPPSLSSYCRRLSVTALRFPLWAHICAQVSRWLLFFVLCAGRQFCVFPSPVTYDFPFGGILAASAVVSYFCMFISGGFNPPPLHFSIFILLNHTINMLLTYNKHTINIQ